MTMRDKSRAFDVGVPVSAEDLRSVFDAVPDELLVIDANYVVILANRTAEERFGVFASLGQPLHCFQINHHRNRPCREDGAPCIAEKVMKGRKQITEEHVHYDEFGNEIYVEVSGAPIFNADGKVVRVLEICRDISERKAEEKRRFLKNENAQKFESLGVLAGGIAHELNTLMMGLINNADLAMETMADQAMVRVSLEGIMDSAKQASFLADQMLAYAGRGTFINDVLSFHVLFETIRDEIETSIPRHIVLKYDLKEAVPPVKANDAQIHQILINLLNNAADAIGDTMGVITIGTGVMECNDGCKGEAPVTLDVEAGTYGYLEVSDTGVGMDQDIMSRIFDPFFTTRKRGRGLGLTAVLGIVRSQRGAIDVFSEPGVGTTFRILFPVADDADVPL